VDLFTVAIFTAFVWMFYRGRFFSSGHYTLDVYFFHSWTFFSWRFFSVAVFTKYRASIRSVSGLSSLHDREHINYVLILRKKDDNLSVYRLP